MDYDTYFSIGDRVAIIEDEGILHTRGMVGTVVFVGNHRVGVEHDNFDQGHDCHGLCKYGRGRYYNRPLQQLAVICKEFNANNAEIFLQ